MYLSRVEIDIECRDTMIALAAPQRFHGAVENSFAGERRRRLWRLDRLNGRLYMLILSEDKPDLNGVVKQFGTGEPPQIKDYGTLLDRVVPGSTWRFRLTANPTKSIKNPEDPKGRGSVVAHCTTHFQKQWLLEKAEKQGFSLKDDEFDVMSSHWLHFEKNGKRTVSMLSVTYEGLLQVTDKDMFCRMLCDGIGRGKAYGLGMMTVMHTGGRDV